MAEKLVIVVGDKTTHGGTVISGNESLEISDKAAACLGDKVSCPLHGETTIIEGFHSMSLNPNKTLAYDGCKTSCGAELIAGCQTILFVETDSSHCLVSAPASDLNQNEDEFKLFVATVWGEVANQSEAAWQAVGSVIINRVGHPYWGRRATSVTKVILNTGFDAAANNQNHEFKKAHTYLFHENSSNILNEFEKKTLARMQSLLIPIYYNKQVTTNAHHYYSPKEQQRQHQHELTLGVPEEKCRYKKIPTFTTEKTVNEVHVKLSPHDDLKFYHRTQLK
ncbi:MAG: PAAR domain-containing protein [Gammaproteobacteria bacterium]|nr:PAAR domain-containing protein [Gammaproteobacteria bacterium]